MLIWSELIKLNMDILFFFFNLLFSKSIKIIFIFQRRPGQGGTPFLFAGKYNRQYTYMYSNSTWDKVENK